MINVTKAYLPDRAKLDGYIDRIYKSHWLTNDGEFVRELEKRLAEYLGVRHIVLVSNGTLALQVAYKALGLVGNVVTTPFSFVATASSLKWEGLEPRFADIDKLSLNLDPEKAENLIDGQTSAILGVHVFGRPCDVEAIDTIAKKRKLKVVYDAAHAFGVKVGDESVLNWGDASTLSFHATKIFHTIEGGAIITPHKEVYDKIKKIINFGITGPEKIEGLGINAKMNEFQAAMGLCILDEMELIVGARESIHNYYYSQLPKEILPVQLDKIRPNFSYFPILLKDENQLLVVRDALVQAGINPRRYFYPSLNKVDYLGGASCPISEDVASRVLCLPIFPSLSSADMNVIVSTVLKALRG